jgi:hypothetical protein
MKLREIAHARSGDKGNILNISLIAYDEEDYPRLERHVTVERVKAHLAGIACDKVVRYEVPNVGALNFVLHAVLGGGVTRLLALDAHGKSLSFVLLSMEVPDEARR